jgi:CubicO group peptidase (beta-lactamase class C family)
MSFSGHRLPGGSPNDLQRVVAAAVTRAAQADAVAPAVGVLVGAGHDVLVAVADGVLADDRSRCATIDTVFDLSSLTKPLVTAASILLLIADGCLRMETAACEIVPELLPDDPQRRTAVTVRRLLTHCSGLPAHDRFWERVAAADAGTRRGYASVVEQVVRTPLAASPGSSAVYSDLGFILLGEIVERLSGRALDVFAQERIVTPLAVDSVGFRPRAGSAVYDTDLVAPCGPCQWRGVDAVRGEVQDENAWAMGGVAGHAGLFGDLLGVHALVAEWVEAYHDRGRVLDGELVRAFWTPSAEPAGTTWAHGWDTPSLGISTAGTLIGRPALGHLGFTGTSTWIDLRRGIDVIVLTNRIHPDRESMAIREFRPQIHDLIFGCLGMDGAGSSAAPSGSQS